MSTSVEICVTDSEQAVGHILNKGIGVLDIHGELPYIGDLVELVCVVDEKSIYYEGLKCYLSDAIDLHESIRNQLENELKQVLDNFFTIIHPYYFKYHESCNLDTYRHAGVVLTPYKSVVNLIQSIDENLVDKYLEIFPKFPDIDRKLNWIKTQEEYRGFIEYLLNLMRNGVDAQCAFVVEEF